MTISTKMMKGILSFIGVLFLLAPLTVFAGDDLMMMITPALAGANRTLKNVITVAKGNGKFTDPVAAVNSITDASATNPYLVLIGPGVYTITQTLVMKPYVDIVGSGENATKVKGAISAIALTASAALVSGSNNSALSSLTVENTGGGGSFSIALYNYGASPRLTNVTATASGGSTCYGISNSNSSSPMVTGVTAMASGGAYNYGFRNNSSSPTMTGVTAMASGGSYNYAVYNISGSSPTMTDVTATASGGASYGVYNNTASSPVIRRSTMNGGTDGLNTGSGTGIATISQSTIIGGVSGTATKTCVACDNGSGTALNASCE